MIFSSLDRFLDILREFPEYRETELFNDESGIVWGGNRGVQDFSRLNFRNTHYSAGFICKLVDMYCRRLVDRRQVKLGIVDIDNCQLQWEKRLFSGHRSQLTPLFRYPSRDLLRKPVFNAYVLLSHLGREPLSVQCRDRAFGVKFGCLATREGRSLALIVWNFEDGSDDTVNARRFRLRLSGIRSSGAYRLIHYRIDHNHSNSYARWCSLGKPDRPTVGQIRALREAEDLELAGPVEDIQLHDGLTFTVDLPMHAVSLLKLVPAGSRAPGRPVWLKGESETGVRGNRQVFLAWRPSPEADFLHYRVWRKAEPETEPRCLNEQRATALYVDMDVEPGKNYIYALQAANASGRVSAYSDELEVFVP